MCNSMWSQGQAISSIARESWLRVGYNPWLREPSYCSVFSSKFLYIISVLSQRYSSHCTFNLQFLIILGLFSTPTVMEILQAGGNLLYLLHITTRNLPLLQNCTFTLLAALAIFSLFPIDIFNLFVVNDRTLMKMFYLANLLCCS